MTLLCFIASAVRPALNVSCRLKIDAVLQRCHERKSVEFRERLADRRSQTFSQSFFVN